MIYEGKCEAILPTLESDLVDAIVTDPPYGLGNREPSAEEIDLYLSGRGTLDTGGDFMGKDWEIPSVHVWKECLRLLKPGRLLFSFGGTRTFDLIDLGIQEAGFTKLGAILWVYSQGWPKGGDVSKRMEEEEGQLWKGWGMSLKPSWEPILVYSKGSPAREVDFITTNPFFYCSKAPKSEATLKGEVENDHPTKKPVKLMRHLVALAASPKELVLDPYFGSGTTGVACIYEGLKFAGIEMNHDFYEIAAKRCDLVLADEGPRRNQRELFHFAQSLDDDDPITPT